MNGRYISRARTAQALQLSADPVEQARQFDIAADHGWLCEPDSEARVLVRDAEKTDVQVGYLHVGQWLVFLGESHAAIMPHRDFAALFRL